MEINGSAIYSRVKYINERCEALARSLEKIEGIETYHESSGCAGCSNYIDVSVNGSDGEEIESFQIKISDHFTSGYGDLNYDVNFQGYHGKWNELKNDLMNDVQEKISEIREKNLKVDIAPKM